jgi:hypothetical protein
MSFRIDDETVERAFEILKAGDHAKARAGHEFAEKQLKVTLAKCQLKAEGKTVGEREASALASSDYARALEAFRLVAEGYYAARDKREAAAALIEAWRTQRSDERAMMRVG